MCEKTEHTTRKKETRILCLKENYTSCVKRIKTERGKESAEPLTVLTIDFHLQPHGSSRPEPLPH